jgi:hypothetical protein
MKKNEYCTATAKLGVVHVTLGNAACSVRAYKRVREETMPRFGEFVVLIDGISRIFLRRTRSCRTGYLRQFHMKSVVLHQNADEVADHLEIPSLV